MIIIGITGTLGAGKGTIVDYLVKEKQFVHFSVRSFLAEEVKKRGLVVNRDNFTVVANSLRSKKGASFIIESIYAQAEKTGQNSIIESIRTVGEIEFLQSKKNFYLFAVDADSLLRYKRIVIRGSETDHVTYEKFISDEQREMTSANPNQQNLQACIAKADYTFLNDGNIQELQNKVEEVLRKL